MDGCLIVPKSGAKFPKDASDWKFLSQKVPAKLKDLHNNGFKVLSQPIHPSEKAACRSVFLAIWHCILSADFTKILSFRLFFLVILPTGMA